MKLCEKTRHFTDRKQTGTIHTVHVTTIRYRKIFAHFIFPICSEGEFKTLLIELYIKDYVIKVARVSDLYGTKITLGEFKAVCIQYHHTENYTCASPFVKKASNFGITSSSVFFTLVTLACPSLFLYVNVLRSPSSPSRS